MKKLALLVGIVSTLSYGDYAKVRITAREDSAEAPKTKTIRHWVIVLQAKDGRFGQPLVPMTNYAKSVLEGLDRGVPHECDMDIYDNNIIGLGSFYGAFAQVFDVRSCVPQRSAPPSVTSGPLAPMPEPSSRP